MGKGLRAKKRKQVTLFTRIMMGLTLPFLCLIFLFAAIQLANEMRAINKSYELSSRFAFESVHRTFEIQIQRGKQLADPAVLPPLVERLENMHEEIEINIFNLLERSLVLPGRSPWNEFDKKSLEMSLYQKQQGKGQLIRIDKESKKLLAYIPLENRQGEITMVAKVAFPLASIGEALANSRWVLLLMLVIISLTGAAIGFRLSNSIIKPIKSLNEATHEIFHGKLGRHVHIDTGDEIEELSHTFNKMSDSLKEMKQRAQDANPLTGLPGNQGIFQELKRRIHERQKFVLYHTDLDRFKVFNDHFGLGKGDDAIKSTADLLRKACKEVGAKDDFIGHQGGDDYVVITRPNTAVALGEYITKNFAETVAKPLYPKEDYERGYTMQLDRRRLAETGEEVMTKFPLIALSLAGVSNVKKDFADYFDCMSAAVAVKKEVKQAVESSYLIKE